MRFLIAILCGLLFGAPGFAMGFQADGLPPETPESTANEMDICLQKASAFKLKPPAFNAVRERCIHTIHGMTAFEFLAMESGCIEFRNEYAASLCGDGVEVLRPLFVARPAKVEIELSGPQLAAIESGCELLKDTVERGRCESGATKVRALLIARE